MIKTEEVPVYIKTYVPIPDDFFECKYAVLSPDMTWLETLLKQEEAVSVCIESQQSIRNLQPKE